MKKVVKKIKKFDQKKEKVIVEALKKSIVENSEKDKSDLEKEVLSNNFNENAFVEGFSEVKNVAPILRKTENVAEILEELPAVPRTRASGDQNVQYNLAERTNYFGEEAQANRRRESEDVMAMQNVRKLRSRREFVDSRDLFVEDSRIIQNPMRPRLLERNENEKALELEDRGKYSESRLPFQEDKKKYRKL